MLEHLAEYGVSEAFWKTAIADSEHPMRLMAASRAFIGCVRGSVPVKGPSWEAGMFAYFDDSTPGAPVPGLDPLMRFGQEIRRSRMYMHVSMCSATRR